MKKINCPVCAGSGEIDPPKRIADIGDLKKKSVKILRASGFSIREIMLLMHYKSPRAITYLLSK